MRRLDDRRLYWLEPPIVAGRPPPHDLDAEAAVLSAILLSREALDRVLDILRPEHFYSSDANGKIYETAVELALDGKPVDVITLADLLRARDLISRVGGPSYLAQLADKTPAVGHVEAHARVVREKWRLRQAIATCQKIAAEGYGDVGPVQAFLDDAAQALSEIAQGEDRITSSTLHDALESGAAELEPKAAGITGLPTGFTELDAATAGMHAKDVILVGAETGQGKTSFAGSVALHVASTPSMVGDERIANGVLWIGLDNMSREELANRFASMRGKVDLIRLKTQRGSSDDWRRLTSAKGEIHDLPILLECHRSMTPMQVRSKVRAARDAFRRRGDRLALLVLDYFQKLKADPLPRHAREESREGELRRASESLHETAAMFDIPIIMLVQETLIEGRKNPEVRDCKAAGMDAQGRLTISWKHAEKRAAPPGIAPKAAGATATISVLKWRAGKLGPVETHFYPAFTLFTDEAP